MMINPISALAPGAAAPAFRVGPPAPVAGAAGPSFADVLAEMTGNPIAALKSSEAAAIGGIQGKVSVQEVVQSIMTAEESLQAAIAIRDKVVSAYQEISRMAI
jgi:flagellar hook-basal body complex protein FliE